MDKKEVSRLLFESREIASMFNDVVKARMGKEDPWLISLIERIGSFRNEQGWDPHGYGNEE